MAENMEDTMFNEMIIISSYSKHNFKRFVIIYSNEIYFTLKLLHYINFKHLKSKN